MWKIGIKMKEWFEIGVQFFQNLEFDPGPPTINTRRVPHTQNLNSVTININGFFFTLMVYAFMGGRDHPLHFCATWFFWYIALAYDQTLLDVTQISLGNFSWKNYFQTRRWQTPPHIFCSFFPIKKSISNILILNSTDMMNRLWRNFCEKIIVMWSIFRVWPLKSVILVVFWNTFRFKTV